MCLVEESGCYFKRGGNESLWGETRIEKRNSDPENIPSTLKQEWISGRLMEEQDG